MHETGRQRVKAFVSFLVEESHVVTQGQPALAIYKFQTWAISDLGWEFTQISAGISMCVCVCVVWCGGCLPPGADCVCVLVASGGDGKTSVSLMLLVVHSSYHHDPPMGQSGATSTHWFPSVCGFQT